MAASAVAATTFDGADLAGVRLQSQRTRNLQMKRDRSPLCFWNDAAGLCIPDVIGNVPDKQVSEERKYIEVCQEATAQEACEANTSCLWLTDRCTIDVAILNNECFDSSWNVVSRNIQCVRFGTKDKCKSLPGCKWNRKDSLCVTDGDLVQQALDASEAVSASYGTFQVCESTPGDQCQTPCIPAGGRCTSLEIFDGSRFLLPNATSPYCQFQRQILQCIKKSPEECDADTNCQRTQASCAISNQALVTIAYADHPNRLRKIEKALAECPTITTGDACVAFK